MHLALVKSDEVFILKPREHPTISHYLLSLAETIMEDAIETLKHKIEHCLNHWIFKAKQEHGV